MARAKNEFPSNKTERFWVRCTPEEYNKIKELASALGASMGDYVKAKSLNFQILPPAAEEEIRAYPRRATDKKGVTREYIQKQVVKGRAILKPLEDLPPVQPSGEVPAELTTG